MASFSQLAQGITATLRHDPTAVFHIEGSPGTAKSSLCHYIADELGIPPERRYIFLASIHDPVDITGVPSVNDGQTHWNPPAALAKFRKGTGPGMIVVDDLAQGQTSMVNACASMILDRRIEALEFDPGVIFISTGNRAKDKAGSKQLPTHYSNRVCTVTMDFSIDDWSAWAMQNGVPVEAIAFARLRPALINDFDPSRSINPTPRSWTHLWTKVPMDLPSNIYLSIAEGYVGEGPAAEWVAAKDMMAKMPSIDYILMQPTQAEVPEEPAIRYAVTTALAMRATPDNFDRMMEYVMRLPKEFQVLFMTDAMRMHPKVTATKAFIKFAVANNDIFTNG